MRHFLAIAALALAIASTHTVEAGPCGMTVFPPPPSPPDWYNALIIVDVTGSMAGAHATVPVPITKLQQALIQAKDHVLAMQAKAGAKPLNLALWAFDSSFPAPQFIKKILDFPASPTGVLHELGFDPLGSPTPGTVNAAFTPSFSTPLAASACFAVGQLAANFDPLGNFLSGGYQWNMTLANGNRATIERDMFIETDGIENATPLGDQCYGTTSAQTDFTCYESGTWQYALRNKMQTGNPLNDTLSTSKTGLVVNIDLVFSNTITGLSVLNGDVSAHSGPRSFSTAPTLPQAETLYGGLAKMTHGRFRTVTVAANGTTAARIPGDANNNGCVDSNDYNQIALYYGQQCAGQAACIAADLTGDNFVDFSDYLIWSTNVGAGC